MPGGWPRRAPDSASLSCTVTARDTTAMSGTRRTRRLAAHDDPALGGVRHYSTASQTLAIPCPTPMHMVARPWRAPRRRISCASVATSRAPEAPSGCPMRDGAAVHVGLLGVQAQLAHDRDRLRRERLVQLDQVELVHAQAGALQRQARGGDRSQAHRRRVDAGHRRGRACA